MIDINIIGIMHIQAPYKPTIVHIDGPNGQRQYIILGDQIFGIPLYKGETMKLEVIEENVLS